MKVEGTAISRIFCSAILIWMAWVTLLPAAESLHLDPVGATGKLVIGGGGKLPAEVRRQFLKWAGGSTAQLLIIPTASVRADDPQASSEILKGWQDEDIKSAAILHTRSRETANDPEFVAALDQATGVWFVGGIQQKIAESYVGTLFEQKLMNLLARGGVVGGSSAGAAIQSRLMIQSGTRVANCSTGFDLLPGTVIDQHFSERNRLNRLTGVMDQFPRLVGLGIDESTALLVDGRWMRVVGSGKVTVCWGHGTKQGLDALQKTYQGGELLDLTSLRRIARDRWQPVFPPRKPKTANVKHGSLMIVGGGGMSLALVKEFVELAGGKDASLVVLPTAMPDPIIGDRSKQMFAAVGAKNVTVLVQRKREDVESPEVLQVLKEAQGIWFGGGRQWRFVDAYENTKAYSLLHDVLRRGGVIGGSSAGASIQGDYLARGNPLGNLDIMAAGYERGFGFLGGVAIDQHFSQRNRFADMASLVKRYPQILGIGIDEATALIVKGRQGEIRGPGQVHFYDSAAPVQPNATEYLSLSAGQTYDLVKRQILQKR